MPFFPLFLKFPPLPAKAQVNVSAKTLKQLGERSISHPHSKWTLSILYLHDIFLVSFPPSCVSCAGFLGLGEWQLYSQALETFLRHVATHSTLNKNSAVESFLTSTEVRTQLHFFFFYTALFTTHPCDQNKEEHKVITKRNLMPF